MTVTDSLKSGKTTLNEEVVLKTNQKDHRVKVKMTLNSTHSSMINKLAEKSGYSRTNYLRKLLLK